jgi:hypothetical protein
MNMVEGFVVNNDLFRTLGGENVPQKGTIYYIYQNIYFPQMVEKEPKLFRKWDPYMKTRQVVASAVIFKNHGWSQWQAGHAKLFGVLLWNYETKKNKKFKYSKTLKKQGYCRTHNYRLLKPMIYNKLLRKEGNGYYSFEISDMTTIKRVLMTVRKLDMIGEKEMLARVKQKSQSTA